MYTLQARRKNSRVIEVIEIQQDIIMWLKLITACDDNKINLTKHKQEILEYLNYHDNAGSSLLIRILQRYEQVDLIRH
jgi:hypothetical protein